MGYGMKERFRLVWYWLETRWTKLLRLFGIEPSIDPIPEGVYCYEWDEERNKRDPQIGSYYIKPCKYYRSTPKTKGVACTYVGYMGFDPTLQYKKEIQSIFQERQDSITKDSINAAVSYYSKLNTVKDIISPLHELRDFLLKYRFKFIFGNIDEDDDFTIFLAHSQKEFTIRLNFLHFSENEEFLDQEDDFEFALTYRRKDTPSRIDSCSIKQLKDSLLRYID